MSEAAKALDVPLYGISKYFFVKPVRYSKEDMFLPN
jgi:hypothetical protein